MRKPIVFGLLGAVVFVSLIFLLSTLLAPKQRGLEVVFQSTTNDAGTNCAVFQVVNRGPETITLWNPPQLRTESGTEAEITSFKGRQLAVGASQTFSVVIPLREVRWQAGFYYDYAGWRGVLEDWGWMDRRRKTVLSKWIEPEGR